MSARGEGQLCPLHFAYYASGGACLWQDIFVMMSLKCAEHYIIAALADHVLLLDK